MYVAGARRSVLRATGVARAGMSGWSGHRREIRDYRPAFQDRADGIGRKGRTYWPGKLREHAATVPDLLLAAAAAGFR
jgi:hypothetical protein